ncbi:class I SAM-dependent methyltransferase [Alteromonas sp. CYL-A6]|uniref:class I SAM-dependent methyltransferase n=1 Tax=Alteromonas nitratireducens TaxID=3390813 RepID=UPI0034B50165
MSVSVPCPLCDNQTSHSEPYATDKRRTYYQCPRCQLVFVSPDQLPSADQEIAEYALHNNVMEDEGYARFLTRLAAPLSAVLTPGQQGLDFGCGPAPLLAKIMQDKGFEMQIYDPFFAKNDTALATQYDFITCSEAIEHFHTPHKELTLLASLLLPQGWLGIMTKRVLSKARFAQWHYKNDPTHVSFFSEATFQYWADTHGFHLTFPSADVVLMQKTG